MAKLIEYECKDCSKLFYIPKVINPFSLIKEKKNEAMFCPFCASHSLFNVTLEQELGTLPEGSCELITK